VSDSLFNLIPSVDKSMAKAGVDISDIRAAGENPGKTNRRGLEIGHPVVETFCAAECDNDKSSAAGRDRVKVCEMFGEIDPDKAW